MKGKLNRWQRDVLRSGCGSSGKVVAVAIAGYMDWYDLGSAYPGPSRLAEDTNLSLSTVKRSLAALVAAGWLQQVHKGGFPRRASIYRASWPRRVNHDRSSVRDDTPVGVAEDTPSLDDQFKKSRSFQGIDSSNPMALAGKDSLEIFRLVDGALRQAPPEQLAAFYAECHRQGWISESCRDRQDGLPGGMHLYTPERVWRQVVQDLLVWGEYDERPDWAQQ